MVPHQETDVIWELDEDSPILVVAFGGLLAQTPSVLSGP